MPLEGVALSYVLDGHDCDNLPQKSKLSEPFICYVPDYSCHSNQYVVIVFFDRNV